MSGGREGQVRTAVPGRINKGDEHIRCQQWFEHTVQVIEEF
jgi:hypothetical protein